nr:MAG TPA: hypothetical protein [Caudoviricetes sp.]
MLSIGKLNFFQLFLFLFNFVEVYSIICLRIFNKRRHMLWLL